MTRADISRANFFPAFLCLGCLALNHSIFRLGSMPRLWAVAVLAAVALVVATASDVKPAAPDKRAPLRIENWAIGLLLLAPVLASFILGLHREFPFSGDQSFQLKQAVYMAFWWLSPVGAEPVGMLGRELSVEAVRSLVAHPWTLIWSRAGVLAALVVVVALCYRKNRLASVAVATVGLTAWGLFEHAIYLRYPGGWYVLAMPFIGPAYLGGNLEMAGRVTNVLAAAMWLFALRPWLIGRWPDASILPVAALLLWQKDMLFYFDSAYTEPWAFVFALLAVENLVRRGAAGVALSCLLIGVAAAIKEPLIVALPFVWLVGKPWRAPLAETLRNTGAAVAGGFPFIVYYAARHSVDIADLVTDRALVFKPSGFGLYLHQFVDRLAIAYSGPSALVALAALASIPVIVWLRPDRRLALFCSLAAGLSIIALFSVDEISLPWAGYFRFFMYALPFLAVGLLAFGSMVKPRTALATGLLAIALQSASAYTAVLWSAGPATGRNFVEHYDAPIVFPLKSLLAEADAKGLLPKNATVLANQPDVSVKAVPGIPVNFAPLGEMVCRCSEQHPDVLALFVRYANLTAQYRDRPPPPGELFAPRSDRDALWRAQRAERPACLAQLRQTCKHVLERVEDNETVAALGVSR